MSSPSEPSHPPLFPSSEEERNLALFCHIGMFIGHFIIPLLGGLLVPFVIWQIKKGTSPFVVLHAKEALNAGISFLFYPIVFIGGLIALGFLFLPWEGLAGIFLLSIILMLLYSLGFLVLIILATIAAGRGGFRPYPMIIRLIR